MKTALVVIALLATMGVAKAETTLSLPSEVLSKDAAKEVPEGFYQASGETGKRCLKRDVGCIITLPEAPAGMVVNVSLVSCLMTAEGLSSSFLVVASGENGSVYLDTKRAGILGSAEVYTANLASGHFLTDSPVISFIPLGLKRPTDFVASCTISGKLRDE
jgi:hypothetical protein